MDPQGTNDDCYFYFYSTCTKGADCPFRHCELALGTETVCSLWREGKCYRSNCRFRHMESRINRSMIRCYWENQPGGCRKPHCVFLHQKYRSIAESQGLIFPVSATAIPPICTSKVPDVKDQIKINMTEGNVNLPEHVDDDMTHSPSSQPVEPFVVSFDEADESDTESVSSTPIKSVQSENIGFNSSSVKINFSAKFSEEKDPPNFGVKTLEQIRMEKIHRESEHFYKSDDTTGKGIASKTIEVNRNPPLLSDTMFCSSAYDAPVIDSSQIKLCSDNMPYSQECYPPESEFISLDRPIDTAKASAGIDSKLSSERENDLRSKLLKKRPRAVYTEKEVPVKRVISLKKQSNQADDSLDFKIKTLDEIRREKENKQIIGNQNESSIMGMPSEKCSPGTNKVLLTVTDSISEKCSPPDGIQTAVTNSSRKDINQNTSLPSVEDNTMDVCVVQKPAGKPKIKRQHKDYLKTALNKVGQSNGDVKLMDRSPMEICEGQDTPNDENKTCTVLSEPEPLLSRAGKRKDLDGTDTDRCNKYQKFDLQIEVVSNDIEGKDSQQSVIQSSNTPSLRTSTLSPLKSTFSLDAEETSEEKSELEDRKSAVAPDELPSSEKSGFTVTSPTASEKVFGNRTIRSLSVDDLDHLFLNDPDVTLDGDADDTGEGDEDILLKIEQLLES